MVNVGLIGKIDSIESQAGSIRDFPGIHIAGKSSTGTLSKQDGFRYSIPELNRTDLIEKSDVLFFTKGSNPTPEILSDIIKRSKHIFLADFFYPTPEEFTEIEKLLMESNSVFQVQNPFLYNPVVQWTGTNFPLPAYFDLNFCSGPLEDNEIYIRLLMLPTGFLGANPSKFRHVSLMDADSGSGFTNFRLEYNDSSVFNFNLNFRACQTEFSLKAFSVKNTMSGNLLDGTLEFDNKPFQQQKQNPKSEWTDFFNAVSGISPVRTGVSEFASVLKIFREISRKNNWTEI